MFKDFVERCLDPAWLSDYVGRDVRAHYVRLKPGTSIAVGFAGAGCVGVGSGCVGDFGWARLLWPGAQGKAAKAVDKARGVGDVLRGAWLDDNVLFQTGGMASDPKLLKALGAAGVASDSACGVLRYNPLRRAVLRDGDRVVRVSARAQLDEATYQAVAGAVNVPALHGVSAGGRVTTVAFVGDGDSAGAGRDAAGVDEMHVAAGRMLARLHAVEVRVEACVRGLDGLDGLDGRAQLEAHAGVLDAVDVGLAARVRAVAGRLPAVDGPAVVLHGDASADQFLYSRTGEVWMTDFDRLCMGPAAMDLGSYLAECSSSDGKALLAGYAEEAELPGEDQLAVARAHSLAARLMTPLRTAQPDWREQVAARLDELEGALS